MTKHRTVWFSGLEFSDLHHLIEMIKLKAHMPNVSGERWTSSEDSSPIRWGDFPSAVLISFHVKDQQDAPRGTSGVCRVPTGCLSSLVLCSTFELVLTIDRERASLSQAALLVITLYENSDQRESSRIIYIHAIEFLSAFMPASTKTNSAEVDRCQPAVGEKNKAQ